MNILKISKITTFLVSMMMLVIFLCFSTEVQAEQEGGLYLYCN